MPRMRVIGIGTLALLAGLFAAIPPTQVARAQGQIFTVTNDLDDGEPGSLSDAIAQANENPGAETVDFNIPGAGPQTVTLQDPLPNITDDLLIMGDQEPNRVTLVGTSHHPLLAFDPPPSGEVQFEIVGLDLQSIAPIAVELAPVAARSRSTI